MDAVRALGLELNVTMEGPTYISTAGSYDWNAAASGGSGSYTYKWQYSEDGINWQQVSTSQTYSRYIGEGEYEFYLRVTATSDGYTDSDQTTVLVRSGSGCSDGEIIC